MEKRYMIDTGTDVDTDVDTDATYDMTMNMCEIKKRVDDGLITVRKHPFLNIFICNYTAKTQYRELWDQYTERCRGLIIDESGNILNNPFPKFFNLGEKEYTKIDALPLEVPKITEKLDGMLGILYEEGDNVAISTRGMFDSPYAEWATNWLRLKGFKLDDFKKGFTYLFEIIYPGNKIIVDYKGREDLVLLAIRNNCNNMELNHIEEARRLGLSYAKEYSFDNISDALEYLETRKGIESEGLVCKYSNGLRIKMKSVDYKRLHKILTGISARDIWISLRDTGSIDGIIDNVPDEFMLWVKRVETELRASKMEVMGKALTIALGAKDLESRIEQAQYISECAECTRGLGGIAFLLLDGKMDKAEYFTWRMIRPSGEIFKGDDV
jgi:RNA ligase